jgi:hypothetical protein
MTTHERVTLGAIERASGDAPGLIRGVVATEGEAQDGNILSIKGGVCEPPVPMLFCHNAYEQEGTVGSWSQFTKSKGRVMGVGQIELQAGAGENLENRQDLAAMTDAGHFRALSVRWEEIDPPVRRVNLSKDHPAFVDASKEQDYRKLYGYFFPTWRLLEASIVPLGADPSCVIGRMRARTGPVREMWRGVVSSMLARGPVTGAAAASIERFRAAVGELHALNLDDFGTLLRACGETRDPSMFHAVEYGEGKRVLIPREAYDALTRESAQRLEVAFDLLADVTAVGEIAELELLEREVPAEKAAPKTPERVVAVPAAPQGVSEAELRALFASANEAMNESLPSVLRANARAAAGR